MPTYKPFKVNVYTVLDEAYKSQSSEYRDKLREFASTSEFKQLFGQRMVDRIVDRTKLSKGTTEDGATVPLGKYSKAYKDSLIFQIYGKSDPVNLTLTGEMLESINSQSSGRALIIIDVDEDNRDKAKGHITGKLGKYGRAQPRPFLGLPPAEINKLFRESMRDYRADALVELFV